MRSISFGVRGTAPVPKGSFVVIRGNMVPQAKKQLVTWTRMLADAATAEMRRLQSQSFFGACDVEIVFYCRRPRRAGDIDKLARAVLDAMTGIVYLDDDVVVSLRATKVVAEPTELGADVFVMERS